ncbi:MAG: hypothetical protein JWL73_1182 [Actinomycetia bacterium]|nr:hypothetical protein [Actinomycetes bacterium]
MIARFAARVLSAGLLVAALAMPAVPAHAQTAPATTTTTAATGTTNADSQPHIQLDSISAYGVLGGNVSMALRLTGPLTGLALRVTAFSAVTSRTAYERTIDGKSLGSVVGTETYDIAGLPTDTTDSGRRELIVGIQDPAAARDATRFSLRKVGVFPLKVDLVPTTSGPTLDGFVTHLVVTTGSAGTPTSIGEKLQVAWVWPVVAPSARQPDGSPDPSVVAQFRADGRLGRIAAEIPQASALPLTLRINPETAQSWSQLSQSAPNDPTLVAGIQNLVAQAPTHEVLSEPYVPLDIPALQAAGLAADVTNQLTQGARVLENVLKSTPAATTVTAPLDDAALGTLHSAGIDHLVLDGVPLEQGVAPQFTPAQPFQLQSAGRTAVNSDRGLVDLLNGTGTPALRAQRLLAGLAVVALEQPNARRGVALVMADDWNPSTDMLNAMIGGLEGNPFMQAATVDEVMNRVPTETRAGVPVVRRLSPVKAGRAPVTAAALAAARSKLAAFQTLVGAGAAAVQAAQHAQLVALSSQWKGAAGRGEALAQLDSVDQAVNGFANEIQITTNRTFTLTARRGTIPLSFKNLSSQPISVRVQLQSDRLHFPGGADQQLLLLPGTTTVGKFAIETRTGGPGTVPLKVNVTSADGSLALQSSTLNVHSTVVNGVGVFLTVAAIVFLALWWLVHFRRRRRTRSPRPVLPTPVHQPA